MQQLTADSCIRYPQVHLDFNLEMHHMDAFSWQTRNLKILYIVRSYWTTVQDILNMKIIYYLHLPQVIYTIPSVLSPTHWPLEKFQ